MIRPVRASMRLPVLALLLVFAVVLAAWPASVGAVVVQQTGPWHWVPYSGSMITIVGHDAYSGVLEVPKTLEVATGDNRTVVGIGDSAFRDMTGLTGIFLPASIMTIGTSAFEGCTSLAYATIPINVNVLSPSTFKGCSALDFVVLPNSLSTIGDSAFEGCAALDSLEIPDSMSTIGARAFYGSGLASALLPGNLDSLGSEAFAACADLEEITFFNEHTTIGADAMMDTGLAADGIYGWHSSTANDYAIAADPTIPFHMIDTYPPVLWADDAWDDYFDTTQEPGAELPLGGMVTTGNDGPSTITIYAAVDGRDPTVVDTVTLTPYNAPADAALQGVPIIYGGEWSGSFTLPSDLPGGYHYLRLLTRSNGGVWGIPQAVRFYVEGSAATPTPTPGATPTDTPNPETGDARSFLPFVLIAVLAAAVLLLFRKSSKRR